MPNSHRIRQTFPLERVLAEVEWIASNGVMSSRSCGHGRPYVQLGPKLSPHIGRIHLWRVSRKDRTAMPLRDGARAVSRASFRAGSRRRRSAARVLPPDGSSGGSSGHQQTEQSVKSVVRDRSTELPRARTRTAHALRG